MKPLSKFCRKLRSPDVDKAFTRTPRELVDRAFASTDDRQHLRPKESFSVQALKHF